MRQIIALALVLLTASHLDSVAFAAESVKSRITSMPPGARVEIRLKNKQRLAGARGAVTDTGFTLVDPFAGDRQISFNDVAQVGPPEAQSHKLRNTLMGVGIGVGIAVVVVAVLVRIALGGLGG